MGLGKWHWCPPAFTFHLSVLRYGLPGLPRKIKRGGHEQKCGQPNESGFWTMTVMMKLPSVLLFLSVSLNLDHSHGPKSSKEMHSVAHCACGEPWQIKISDPEGIPFLITTVKNRI